MEQHERPEVGWFCVYCGWECTDSRNEYLCIGCSLPRPVFPLSATVVQCHNCEQLNLVLAKFCEWCGAQLQRDR